MRSKLFTSKISVVVFSLVVLGALVGLSVNNSNAGLYANSGKQIAEVSKTYSSTNAVNAGLKCGADKSKTKTGKCGEGKCGDAKAKDVKSAKILQIAFTSFISLFILSSLKLTFNSLFEFP